jgi:hypothetical protein
VAIDGDADVQEQVPLALCSCRYFCGGGSTIVMAAQLNPIGFDCEIDAGYVAVELERLTPLWN